jgi:LDH2 family malate/lactate/ureidoglycolate dehydrogenase
MVLDIANTAVARGKIYHARQAGVAIPDTWAITASGERTTDPLEAISGILLPMAGHKGYGIALMMDVLSGVLTGSEFGAAVVGPYDPRKRSGCGHLAIALDVEAFQPLDEYFERMDRLVAQLHGAPLASGHDAIFYPGEPEARSEQKRLAEGIELPRDTAKELRELASACSVDAAVLGG